MSPDAIFATVVMGAVTLALGCSIVRVFRIMIEGLRL